MIDIAENEFGLSRIAVPERFRDNIVQRMDEHEGGQERRMEGEGDAQAKREDAVNLRR